MTSGLPGGALLYLIGTSSGGNVAYRYTSSHLDHVERLVLINSAGRPRTAQTDPNRGRSEFQKWVGMPVKAREFWAYIRLNGGIEVPSANGNERRV